MKKGLLALLLLLPLVLGGRWLGEALEVAAAYSAKQLCSGVFVAGLSEEFILQNDIRLSLGSLGPLLSQLQFEVDRDAARTESSLLGVKAEAVLTGDAGCVLNPVQPVAAADRSKIGWLGFSGQLNIEQAPALDAVLDAAFTEPAQGQRRTLAVLVMRGRELVAERYAEGVNLFTPLQGWSMNKSLMSTWVGMQVERGLLDLEQAIAPTVALADPALAQSLHPGLNLGHLLHMESGLHFEETYFPGDDATRMLYRSPAAWRVAPANAQRFAPGQHFSYSSGDTNLASWIWQQSLCQPYTEWLQEQFSGRLALTRMISEHDASGVQVGSSYTYMTARDWAAVGRFWLSAWQHGTRLLPEGWMRDATTPRPSARDGNYGRGFWLNSQGLAFPSLPRNLFYASGHNGQYVVMFPTQDIVVVRLGLASDSGSSGIAELLSGVLANVPALGRIEVAQPADL